MKKYTTILLTLLGLSVFTACEDSLDLQPTTAIDAGEAVVDYTTLSRAALGAYSALQSSNYYGQRYLLYQDLYSDNLSFSGTFTTDREVANRNIDASNLQISSTWAAIYTLINRANTVIRQADQLDNITTQQRDNIKGQMLVLRGLAYFDLVKVFGGVPVIQTPTTVIEEIQFEAKSTQAQVYDAIISDLKMAESILPSNVGSPQVANIWAAKALLARVYLQRGSNAEAATYASDVIMNSPYELEANFADIFSNEGNSEVILEVDFTLNDQNVLGSASDPSTPGQKFYVSTEAYNALQASDANAQNASTPTMQYEDERFEATTTLQGTRRRLIKYSDIVNNADDVPVIRLAEMYLIRAEANARQGIAVGAASPQVIQDINTIRTRAGLNPVLTLTNAAALNEILEQRRLEFIGEGLRFIDLKRYNITCLELEFCEDDNTAYRNLWPIPLQQIEVNPALTQNPGY
ncbi:RagB/SusD family nutrient uptake outer membrane protein [Pontibacter oryzae]|uniref:RagB/SusD family nutrient uptake outer membrane protein n=1 Tax=Pontibacter oryzae TaxID=2304593 RepID=A0A399SF43_9BACT|nr:RagB/SusD family nutrient uptake outer membrane protein [Pontibacter oryzae]RIJ42736.1 RagB/SusD family nutrient uptake outer membrane protein [Pontibacter oryzae]